MAETPKPIRISIQLPSDEMREAFFQWCRKCNPRVSMNERLLTHIANDLKLPPIGTSKSPRRA